MLKSVAAVLLFVKYMKKYFIYFVVLLMLLLPLRGRHCSVLPSIRITIVAGVIFSIHLLETMHCQMFLGESDECVQFQKRCE